MRLTFIWAILFGTIAGALIVCASSTSSHLLPSVQADEPAPNRPAKTKPATKTPDSTAPSGSASHSLFEKRILPILQSKKPSSCAECHLSAVDLKDYIYSTPEETFSALVNAQMIDLEKPKSSKILSFIKRQSERPSLLSENARNEEYSAFEEWIVASVADPELRKHRDPKVSAGPAVSLDVVRHARKDRVLASFVTSIWTEAGRCAACHSSDRNQEQVKKHGKQVSWITPNNPEATLNYLLESGLIDPENPENSTLLLKPTLQVKHGGGQKMVVGDRSYKQFRRFLDDYAATLQGKYKRGDDLPAEDAEVSQVSEIWLKLTGVPKSFDKMLLQVDLYRWENGKWSKQRVATSDRQVFGPQNLWQHSLSLTATSGSAAAKDLKQLRLARGKYLIKIYVDQKGKLQDDFTAILDEKDLVGQVEVESGWPAGYGSMTVVAYPNK